MADKRSTKRKFRQKKSKYLLQLHLVPKNFLKSSYFRELRVKKVSHLIQHRQAPTIINRMNRTTIKAKPLPNPPPQPQPPPPA